MTSSDRKAPPLPRLYIAVIAFSAVVLFALGVVYFATMNPARESSFRLYGGSSLVSDSPSMFEVVQFDNDRRQTVPCKIVSATLTAGRVTVLGVPQETVHSIPATVTFPATPLPGTTATLTLNIAGWENEERSVQSQIPISPVAPEDGVPTLPQVGLSPVPDRDWTFGLIPRGAGLPDHIPTNLWVLTRRADGSPLGIPFLAALNGQLDDRVYHSGLLGLASIRLNVTGMNPELDLRFLEDKDSSVSVKQFIPPDRLMSLSATEQVFAPGSGTNLPVAVATTNESEDLFCSLWTHGIPTRLFRGTSVEGKLELLVPVPDQAGIHWLGCSGTYLTNDGFMASMPLWVTTDPRPTLIATMESFGHSLPVDEMRDGDWNTLRQFALDVMESPVLETTPWVNTMQADQERISQRVSSVRDILVSVMAAVGGLLLLWAVLVVAFQHRRLKSDFRAFSQEEDVGEELEREGLHRKGGALPLILVLLTAVANLAALIWLLRVILGH